MKTNQNKSKRIRVPTSSFYCAEHYDYLHRSLCTFDSRLRVACTRCAANYLFTWPCFQMQKLCIQNILDSGFCFLIFSLRRDVVIIICFLWSLMSYPKAGLYLSLSAASQERERSGQYCGYCGAELRIIALRRAQAKKQNTKSQLKECHIRHMLTSRLVNLKSPESAPCSLHLQMAYIRALSSLVIDVFIA